MQVFFGLLLSASLLCGAYGRNFVYNKYDYNDIITVTVNENTEQILDFVETNTTFSGFPTRVHVSSNATLSVDHPVFVTASQQKGVSSWQLPLVITTPDSIMKYNNMAYTMCPLLDSGDDTKFKNPPLVRISTTSPSNMSISIKLRRVEEFYVGVDQDVETEVKPSTPKYYYFSFDYSPPGPNLTDEQMSWLKINHTIPKSVILMIKSDDLCAIVSIHNNSCPGFDHENDIIHEEGRFTHLTMSSNGGITLSQVMYPDGFYVVFTVKQTDDACTGESGTTPNDDERLKTFSFRLTATISYEEYIAGVLATFGISAFVALFAFVMYVPSCRWNSNTQQLQPLIEESTPLPTVATLSSRREVTMRYFWGSLTIAIVYSLPVIRLLVNYQLIVYNTGDMDLCYYNFLCSHPLGILSDFNHVFSNLVYVLLGLVFMGQVRARQGFRRRPVQIPVEAPPDVNGSQEHLIAPDNVATADRDIFSEAPPNAFGSQEHLLAPGNVAAEDIDDPGEGPSVAIGYQDNRFQDSGTDYLIVPDRDNVPPPPPPDPVAMGIPPHHGLFYSLGFALVMEGVLSACYHLCPNQMNFQFDSSFMYVICVLCMIKLYQSRHADVNASAHATFLVVSLIMAIGVAGIMFHTVYTWVIFTGLHVIACFVLTLYIYYAGSINVDYKKVWSVLRTCDWEALVPRRRAIATVLAVANVANVVLAVTGITIPHLDYARHLLIVLIFNTMLYTGGYIALKVIHREKVPARTWIYLVLATCAWGPALKLFLDTESEWDQTPAHSRRHNAQCSALQFYDSHDLWHVASAAALFFSFNILLTVDDALVATPRDHLPIF